MHTHPKRFSSIDVSRKLVLTIVSHATSKLLLFASSGLPMSRITIRYTLACAAYSHCIAARLNLTYLAERPVDVHHVPVISSLSDRAPRTKL
jgi:hypothetical protein